MPPKSEQEKEQKLGEESTLKIMEKKTAKKLVDEEE